MVKKVKSPLPRHRLSVAAIALWQPDLALGDLHRSLCVAQDIEGKGLGPVDKVSCGCAGPLSCAGPQSPQVDDS